MKDRKISFSIKDKAGKEFKFESLKSLKKFLADEHKLWSEVRAGLSSGNLGHIGSYASIDGQFSRLISSMKNFETSLDSWTDEELQKQVQQTLAPTAGQITNRWIWSGHPFCIRWIDIHRKYGVETSNTFIEAFIGNFQFEKINTITNLKGAILAYEFLLQDESTLTKRRNAEKSSVAQVRNSILKAQDQLFDSVRAFQDEFETWNSEIKSSAQRLYNVNQKLGERISRKQRKRFDAQMDEWQQKIEHLENTYQEKLRLEKPASYWNTKASRYFKQGLWWSGGLGLMLIGGLVGFSIFFTSWLQGQSLNIELNSLQGLVIFITIISIYALSLKTLSRMAFSSFHLQRDAEEREQLTHVYLALTHEKDELDIDARNIILQALFSRADTGLLGGDSGPTMPGVHEIFKASSVK